MKKKVAVLMGGISTEREVSYRLKHIIVTRKNKFATKNKYLEIICLVKAKY